MEVTSAMRTTAPPTAIVFFVASLAAVGLPSAEAREHEAIVSDAHDEVIVTEGADFAETEGSVSILQQRPRRGMATPYGSPAMAGSPYAGHPYGGASHGCGQGGCCNGVCSGTWAGGPCGAYGGDCRPCYCCCPYNPWTIAGGFYYLSPHWKTNPAYSTSLEVGDLTTTTQEDFDYDFEIAPFVMAAYRAQFGLGIQGRAWSYDDGERLTVVNDGLAEIQSAGPLGLDADSDTAGEVNRFESSLEIDVVDLLITYLMQFECGSLEFAAGARRARVEQEYNYTQVPGVGGLLEIEAIESSHHFEGVGPSFSLEARLDATTRLSFFGTVRYSLLFGQSEQDALRIDDNVLEDVSSQENDDLLTIAELELGAEYTLRICCAELFLRAAFVSQVWGGAGNSSNNDIITVMDDPEVSDKNADLGLWGFRTELGLRF
jgi:hypothetical protein